MYCWWNAKVRRKMPTQLFYFTKINVFDTFAWSLEQSPSDLSRHCLCIPHAISRYLTCISGMILCRWIGAGNLTCKTTGMAWICYAVHMCKVTVTDRSLLGGEDMWMRSARADLLSLLLPVIFERKDEGKQSPRTTSYMRKRSYFKPKDITVLINNKFRKYVPSIDVYIYI